MADEDLVVCNGIDAATGAYLIPPMSFGELAEKIRRSITKAEADAHQRAADAKKPHLGGRLDENLEDVKHGGWAVVFHKDEDSEVRRALDPLVRHRLEQIGDERRVKVLDYAGESTPNNWLKTNRVEPGDIEPWHVPYYLLVVGSPERIPFKFSQDLAMQYAVGQLHFDQPADYRRYVDSLIAYERGEAEPCSREAVFSYAAR